MQYPQKYPNTQSPKERFLGKGTVHDSYKFSSLTDEIQQIIAQQASKSHYKGAFKAAYESHKKAFQSDMKRMQNRVHHQNTLNECNSLYNKWGKRLCYNEDNACNVFCYSKLEPQQRDKERTLLALSTVSRSAAHTVIDMIPYHLMDDYDVALAVIKLNINQWPNIGTRTQLKLLKNNCADIHPDYIKRFLDSKLDFGSFLISCLKHSKASHRQKIKELNHWKRQLQYAVDDKIDIEDNIDSLTEQIFRKPDRYDAWWHSTHA